VDGCRIEAQAGDIGNVGASVSMHQGYDRPWMHDKEHLEAWLKRKQESNDKAQSLGRWPANLILDKSEEVQECFPDSEPSGSAKSGRPTSKKDNQDNQTSFTLGKRKALVVYPCDSGSASRFFFNFSEQESIE